MSCRQTTHPDYNKSSVPWKHSRAYKLIDEANVARGQGHRHPILPRLRRADGAWLEEKGGSKPAPPATSSTSAKYGPGGNNKGAVEAEAIRAAEVHTPLSPHSHTSHATVLSTIWSPYTASVVYLWVLILHINHSLFYLTPGHTPSHM